MEQITSLINILASSDSRLFITREQYMAELAVVIPFFLSKKEISGKTFREVADDDFVNLNKKSECPITNDFVSDSIPEDSIAYHRVRGTITAESCWRFSTKQLQADILQAESNDKISAHFFHVTSGGGEAWYLDQLAKTMREAVKPTFGFIEKVAGSAGYYIASQTGYVSAATPYDLIGCIGTMVSFMDLQPMLEKFGINFIEEYAKYSDLKNKKYNDLRTGKPDQFITEELDPLRDRFVTDVKSMRPVINALPEDHPVLRGETFYAEKSIENGLIDSIETIDIALRRAYDAGKTWSANQNKRRRAIQYLNP